jgi:hypothetical protein
MEIKNMNLIEDVRKKLQEAALRNPDSGRHTHYDVGFSEKLFNSQKKIIGVFVPDMRRNKKSVAKDLSFDDVLSILQGCDTHIYEEVFTSGIIISYCGLNDEEKIKAFEIYLEYADSWALIDSIVMTKKYYEKGSKHTDDESWRNDKWVVFVDKCMESQKAFVIRFGIVFMLSNLICEDKIDWIFQNLRRIKYDAILNNAYYVRMACAWLYAETSINFFDKTIDELNKESTDVRIKNMAFQKLLQSFRISDEKKKIIRSMKSSS